DRDVVLVGVEKQIAHAQARGMVHQPANCFVGVQVIDVDVQGAPIVPIGGVAHFFSPRARALAAASSPAMYRMSGMRKSRNIWWTMGGTEWIPNRPPASLKCL